MNKNGLLSCFLTLCLCLLLTPCMAGQHSEDPQEKALEEQPDIIVAPPPPPLATFDLPTFSTATDEDVPHFLKLTIALGYEKSPEFTRELVTRKDQIRHAINIILKGKTSEDLDSIEGKISLAEEIKARLNMIFTSGKIKEVYFKEFVMN